MRNDDYLDEPVGEKTTRLCCACRLPMESAEIRHCAGMMFCEACYIAHAATCKHAQAEAMLDRADDLRKRERENRR